VRNDRELPVIVEGATGGCFRLFVVGAATQGNCQVVWTRERVPQLQNIGFKTHHQPVKHCLNCGQLRTDESGWGPDSEGDFCSLRCRADFSSKTSRRRKTRQRRLGGAEAEKAQRTCWRYDVVRGVSQATGGLPPGR
jgi:hypothetical protein